MGSKAWRNLGAIFLASAALVGCNNGPGPFGGPFGGQSAKVQQPPTNPFATAGGVAPAGPQRPGVFPTVPGGNNINPTGGAGNSFNPYPGSPSNFGASPGGVSSNGFGSGYANDQFGRPVFPNSNTNSNLSMQKQPSFGPQSSPGLDPYALPNGSPPGVPSGFPGLRNGAQ